MSQGVQHFRAVGGAKELVETCINDLKMLSRRIDGHNPEDASFRGRRTAVIILYATGEVGVTEGWSIDGGDFKSETLLAAGDKAEC
jgi:hypothetical protein